MSRNIVIIFLLLLLGLSMFHAGRLFERGKWKTVGTIHIEKSDNLEDRDLVRFEFGIQSLEELYSMKQCSLVVDVQNRTTNSSDNDNT